MCIYIYTQLEKIGITVYIQRTGNGVLVDFGLGSPSRLAETWTPVSARSMAQKSVDLNAIFSVSEKGNKIMEY